MVAQGPQLPGDFKRVSGCLPDWIDIASVCKESARYVGLYAVANFNVVAINNGRAVYTTADRNGDFRRNFRRVVDTIFPQEKPDEVQSPTLIYDCEQHSEWLARRESAVRFLYDQF